jgi:hypothetical protein
MVSLVRTSTTTATGPTNTMDDITLYQTVERWWIEAVQVAEHSEDQEDWDSAEALGMILDEMEQPNG